MSKEIKLPSGYKQDLIRIAREASVPIEVGHAVIYRSSRQNQAFISPSIVKFLFEKKVIEYAKGNSIRISDVGRKFIGEELVEKKRRKKRNVE
jgi:hypothetical protein